MRRIIVLLSICLFAAPAFAQWSDKEGHDLPADTARARSGDFSGMLLVTPDADWKQKWDTPPDTTPNFRSTDTVAVGDKVTVLTFFSGPSADAAGLVNIRCDLRVLRPDGSVSTDVKDVECYHGKLQGVVTNVYLAAPSIEVLAEPGDQRGLWRVEITLRDVVAGVTMPLSTQVTLTNAVTPRSE